MNVPTCLISEGIKKYFLRILPQKGGGVGIPKLYVKFWWPLFLATNVTFSFQNLAKIHIFIPKCTEEEGVHKFRKYS